MIDIDDMMNMYAQSMLRKAQSMVDKIKEYPFVRTASLDGTTIKIVFMNNVSLKDQDVLDLFINGGVIKKADESKDKESSYIKVETIGEF